MEKPTRCIIDNFLPTDELEEIEDLIYSQIFPWNTMNAVYEGCLLYTSDAADE